MDAEELKTRTRTFALRVLRLVGSIPRSRSEEIIGKQLARSATSVGANYRAACRARSKPDFVSKITIVEEEADESQYWLELLMELGTANQQEIVTLLEEAKELTAIFTASGKTAKRNR
jgi:four helix bundle protein